MSTDVNQAVTTWNAEHAAATAELEALEATLKVNYNAYIDSLAAYIARVKAANDVRQGYIRVLEIEDVANDTRTLGGFVHSAEKPIENQALEYLLDHDRNFRATPSLVIADACDAAKLLERKAI